MLDTQAVIILTVLIIYGIMAAAVLWRTLRRIFTLSSTKARLEKQIKRDFTV